MNMLVVAASLPLIFLSVVLSCAAASESYTTDKTVAIRGFIIVGTILGLVSGTIAYFAVDDFVASLYMFCVAILAVGLPIYITVFFGRRKPRPITTMPLPSHSGLRKTLLAFAAKAPNTSRLQISCALSAIRSPATMTAVC